MRCVKLSKEEIRVLQYAMHLLEGDDMRIEDGFTDRRVEKVRQKVDDLYADEIEEYIERRK